MRETVEIRSRLRGRGVAVVRRYAVLVTPAGPGQAYATVRLRRLACVRQGGHGGPYRWVPTARCYDVAATEHGPVCDCESFVYVKDGLDGAGCKHIRACLLLGLL